MTPRRTPDRSATASRGGNGRPPDRIVTGRPETPAGRSTASRLFTLFGTVVGPTTVLTALLFYFGRLHAFGFFDHFGVNFTVFDLTATDYILRSADGLFVPLTVAAAVGLVGLWAHRIGMAWLPEQIRRVIVRLRRPAVVVLGLLLLGIAVAGLLDPAAFDRFLALPGLCLAAGVVLLGVAPRIPGPSHPNRPAGTPPPLSVTVAEWAAVFLLASIGLFWAVADYAGAVGRQRGHELEAGLSGWPDLVVHSEKGLNIRGAGTRETACTTSGSAYAFRYDGLKLIFQAGGQYMLLPGGWTADSGSALLLPRSDKVRLEFAAAGRPTDPRC